MNGADNDISTGPKVAKIIRPSQSHFSNWAKWPVWPVADAAERFEGLDEVIGMKGIAPKAANKNRQAAHIEPPAEAKKGVKPYEPTKREKSALEAFDNRQRRQKPAPRFKVVSTNNDATDIKLDHTDQVVGSKLLLEATGTTDADFLAGLIQQLADVGRSGKGVDEGGLNFMLSIVKDIQPRDQVEAMLAAQMAAVHNATMTFARRLNHVENIPQQDSAERAFNKLARTFTSQMEALKRYRSEGQQKILVQHTTTVNADQAVVTTGNPAPSPALLTAGTEKPMPIIDGMTEPEPVGVGVGEKKE